MPNAEENIKDMSLSDVAENFYISAKRHYVQKIKSDEKFNAKPSQKHYFLRHEVFLNEFEETFTKSCENVAKENSITLEQARTLLLSGLSSKSDEFNIGTNISNMKGMIETFINDYSSAQGKSPTFQEQVKQIKENKEVNVNTKNQIDNLNNKQVDFNNPEEKKAFFEDFYKGLSECKTFDDTVNYLKNKRN